MTQASTSSSSFLVSSLWGFKRDRSRVFVCGHFHGAQGTGKWKMSIGNEDNEDNDKARVQVRFCSHVSFFPFSVLVPRSPFAFLVTFLVRSRDWWLSVSEGYFSDNYICRIIRFNLKMGRFYFGLAVSLSSSVFRQFLMTDCLCCPSLAWKRPFLFIFVTCELLLTNWQLYSNHYELHFHARTPSSHLFILLCFSTLINGYFNLEQ